MPEKAIRGSCLCSAVSFQFHGPYRFFQYCHCSRCRKASGTAYAANILVPKENLTWLSGRELLKRYKLPEAERFATTFCTECGSPLPWSTREGRYLIVPAGSLDDEPEMMPERNIYYDSRARWCLSSEDLPKFPEAP